MGRLPSSEPWCIIGKVSWGVPQACKVPESRAHLYTTKAHGWTVLIRDSEMPAPLPATPRMDRLLSGSNRRHWLNEEDVQREIDDDNGANDVDE